MAQSGGMALMRPPYSFAPMRDRITTFFVAVPESALGTKRTASMSANDPKRTSGPVLVRALTLNMIVVSDLCESLVHKSREFCLMARAGLRKGLLQLTAGCSQSDPHRLGSSL